MIISLHLSHIPRDKLRAQLKPTGHSNILLEPMIHEKITK